MKVRKEPREKALCAYKPSYSILTTWVSRHFPQDADLVCRYLVQVDSLEHVGYLVRNIFRHFEAELKRCILYISAMPPGDIQGTSYL